MENDTVLSAFQKNKFEEIRVRYTVFKGYDCCDLRVYVKEKRDPNDKSMIRSGKGLCISVDKVETLINALVEAKKKLKEADVLRDAIETGPPKLEED